MQDIFCAILQSSCHDRKWSRFFKLLAEYCPFVEANRLEPLSAFTWWPSLSEHSNKRSSCVDGCHRSQSLRCHFNANGSISAISLHHDITKNTHKLQLFHWLHYAVCWWYHKPPSEEIVFSLHSSYPFSTDWTTPNSINFASKRKLNSFDYVPRRNRITLCYWSQNNLDFYASLWQMSIHYSIIKLLLGYTSHGINLGIR